LTYSLTVTNGQAVMHYSRNRPTASGIHVCLD